MAQTSDNDDTFLDKKAVGQIIGVNWWSIDRLRRDPTRGFPQPHWISNQSPRWSKAEVLTWMRERPRGGVSPNATRKRLGKYVRSKRGAA